MDSSRTRTHTQKISLDAFDPAIDTLVQESSTFDINHQFSHVNCAKAIGLRGRGKKENERRGWTEEKRSEIFHMDFQKYSITKVKIS